MTNFFDSFSTSTKADWEAQLLADLKGQDLSSLHVYDEVEEISFSSYYHMEDQHNRTTAPIDKRNFADSNSWKNGCLIVISDEKRANDLALKRLNEGVNLLVFKSSLQSTNWSVVLQGIELAHIETQFVLRSIEEYRSLKNLLRLPSENILLNLDFFDKHLNWSNFDEIAADFRHAQIPFCAVNAFKIQQCGANTWQEIGFALATAHEYLVRLMASGMSIDEAAACISFKIGIGTKYVNEIAKFRALHNAWGQLVSTYRPAHDCTCNCRITAVAGHLNKSLKDPYTNLLRQTTEAMSAIIGGIDSIVILPYDQYSNQPSELASRMAINISSIVQEESFLDKVCDPLGGSYSLESLTDIIGEKAWSFFQELEKIGGVGNMQSVELITQTVLEKRSLRIKRIQEGKDVFIGINKYPSPDSYGDQWRPLPEYFGIPYLVLEEAFKAAQVS